MPVYEFRCPECRQAYASQRAFGDTHPPTCPPCNTPTRRRYTPFALKPPMQEHFNASVGAYVSNEREFKDHLKAQSEIATARTGIEHNFVPHDPRESKADLGVTDEGLEATYRRRRELGLETGEEKRSLTGKKAPLTTTLTSTLNPELDPESPENTPAKTVTEEVLWLE